MSFVQLHYHVVFATKQRRPLLAEQLRPRLIEYIGGVLRAAGSVLLEAGGAADHMHLAISASQQQSLANMVRDIKAGSSRWIHDTFGDLRTFAWQDGYAAFSVSHSVMPKVREYIRGQEGHHKELSFDEELAALLERHDVEFDRRYLSPCSLSPLRG